MTEGHLGGAEIKLNSKDFHRGFCVFGGFPLIVQAYYIAKLGHKVAKFIPASDNTNPAP